MVKTVSSGVAQSRFDAVLGLCWLRQPCNSSRLVSGSSTGVLSCTDVSSEINALRADGWDDQAPSTQEFTSGFAQFSKLTSVHVNADDTRVLASGYSHTPVVYDLATGQVVAEYTDVHSGHVNITRFANHSPTIFATSSFDKTVKMWDLRQRYPISQQSIIRAFIRGMLATIRDPSTR